MRPSFLDWTIYMLMVFAGLYLIYFLATRPKEV